MKKQAVRDGLIIKRLRRDGLTLAEISRQTGIPFQRVRYLVSVYRILKSDEESGVGALHVKSCH